MNVGKTASGIKIQSTKAVIQMNSIPKALEKLIDGRSWEQITIGHSDATTYLLKGATSNQYLKIQPIISEENLYGEVEKLEWLHGKLPVPEVLYYNKDGRNEYLLMTEIKGMNAADQSHEPNVATLITQLALGLKTLHNLPIDRCPFDQTLAIKLNEAKRSVENGRVDEDEFDDERKGMKAADLFIELISTKPMDEDLVFTHGDYCLPNIIMDNGKVTGYIDLGRAGVADKYQDLALALRSIKRNFGMEHIPLFLEAYGVKNLEEAKVHYYQLMDEFF